jgi:hypothetical protein
LESYGFQYGENLKKTPNATTNFTSQNHLNVQLHVKYIKQESDETLFKFPDASFSLSSNALAQYGTVVVVLWYKTIHSFLTNTFHDDHIYVKLNSKIITASVRPEPTTESFAEPVRISWNLKELVIQVYFVFD